VAILAAILAPHRRLEDRKGEERDPGVRGSHNIFLQGCGAVADGYPGSCDPD
jgi:hypothetical protein